MASRSGFEKLDNEGAILDVPRTQVSILRPQDHQSAIGTGDFNGHACLVLMGTSPRSAVIMAHFHQSGAGRCTSEKQPGSGGEVLLLTEVEVNYMNMLRKVVKLLLDEHELFQLPLAWVVLGHYDNPALLQLLREKTLKIFQHLRVQTGVSLHEECIMNAAQSPSLARAVFVVRHGYEVPELYVGDRLVYPKDHSGSLALVFDKVGLRQIGHETGDYGGPDNYNSKEWSGMQGEKADCKGLQTAGFGSDRWPAQEFRGLALSTQNLVTPITSIANNEIGRLSNWT
jgi:hypothetical protein